MREVVVLGSSSQQPTRYRNHGGYLLLWHNEGFLLDPGDGTQRQFIFAEVAPPCITRIFISHFHGDHCLGLGSMLLRLNLDKVTHPIHCYYPASGQRYFDAQRYGSIYHSQIQIILHPIENEGVIEEGDTFKIEAYWLRHSVPALGWRFTEKTVRKFDKEKLACFGLRGPEIKTLERDGELVWPPNTETIVHIDEVSSPRIGATVSVILDSIPCSNTDKVARDAALLICESTYLEEHKKLAREHWHMTAMQAATIALNNNVEQLLLTHFSGRYPHINEFGKEAQTIFGNTWIAKDLYRYPIPKGKVVES